MLNLIYLHKYSHLQNLVGPQKVNVLTLSEAYTTSTKDDEKSDRYRKLDDEIELRTNKGVTKKLMKKWAFQ